VELTAPAVAGTGTDAPVTASEDSVVPWVVGEVGVVVGAKLDLGTGVEAEEGWVGSEPRFSTVTVPKNSGRVRAGGFSLSRAPISGLMEKSAGLMNPGSPGWLESDPVLVSVGGLDVSVEAELSVWSVPGSSSDGDEVGSELASSTTATVKSPFATADHTLRAMASSSR
jgi:hypothetical protein